MTATVLAPVNYIALPPYRWYGVGDVPYLMDRHGIDREALRGQRVTSLCGLEITVDLEEPNRIGRRECAECDRLWREETGTPLRPKKPEMP